MTSANDHVFVGRFSGDMSSKSNAVRKRFQQQLVRNIKTRCKVRNINANVYVSFDRLYVSVPQLPNVIELTQELLEKTFGLRACSSIVAETDDSMEHILATGEKIFAPILAGKTFAVRAKRSGQHTFTSSEMAQTLGAKLFPYSAGVNLKHPQVQCYVETRQGRTIYYFEDKSCANGLAPGTQGRALVLFSGGYDSTLAAWYALKRGVDIDFVFCDLSDQAQLSTVCRIAQKLAKDWGGRQASRFFSINFSPVAQHIKSVISPQYQQLVLKRLMYESAFALARLPECKRFSWQAVITGECIGQVSTQTLSNLRTLDTDVALPVLRPLIGFDKEEIIARCGNIGVKEHCAQVIEACGISEARPVTKTSFRSLSVEMQKLDRNLVEQFFTSPQETDLRNLDIQSSSVETVYINFIPQDAVVIYCGSQDEFDRRRVLDARFVEMHEFFRSEVMLDQTQTYLLTCEHGLQSSLAATELKKKGFKAFSFKGGTKALDAYLSRAE